MSAAELTALSADRHPWDWYLDEPWQTEALIKALGFEAFAGQHIHDPCCGRGAILSAFDNFGWSVSGSDVEDRRSAFNLYTRNFPFSIADFRQCSRRFDGLVSIVFNPPYSLQDGVRYRGLTQLFVTKALSLASHKVCVLVPQKWLAGAGRWALFTHHVPSHVLHLSERPSMPPGHLLAAMAHRAFQGGKIDYVWVVFDKQVVTQAGDTRTIWIEPRDRAVRKAGRLAR